MTSTTKILMMWPWDRRCVQSEQTFLCVILKVKWLGASKNRPSVRPGYADDTFALFDDKKPASQFLRYLNSRHINIKFTIEFEEIDEIPVLDDILVKLTTLS